MSCRATDDGLQVEAMIDRLARFPNVLRPMVMGMSATDARWRPDEKSWSVLEIVCHLADEEIDDFRTRLRMTLERPEATWPPIDPVGAAVERCYNEQELDQALRRFLDERHDSLHWLRSLPADTDWSIANEHPKFGPMAAGSMLAAWVAHDWLHLRQLGKRFYQLTVRDAGEYDPRYAGDPPA